MSTPVTIITPCYNEGIVAIRFLQQLQEALHELPYTFHVLMVDDGSTDDTLDHLKQFSFAAGNISLGIISLPENCGHQAAICHGFTHALRSSSDHFIVMDCDGQDSPTVIPALLAHAGIPIVSVVRSHRPESVLFRIGYYSYRALFRLLTGHRMNYGNFCLLHRSIVAIAAATGFTHLAAFLMKQKYSKQFVIAPRSPRLGGKSKMGIGGLVRHAASSFVQYGYGPKLIFRKLMS